MFPFTAGKAKPDILKGCPGTGRLPPAQYDGKFAMAPAIVPRGPGISVEDYLKSFAERRTSSRTSVSREIVVQIDQQPMHTAILENISLGGAKFRLMYPADLPERFEIIGVSEDERPVTCEIVWRRQNAVGVRFTSAKRGN